MAEADSRLDPIDAIDANDAIDAIILAGGRADDEMARKTGTSIRAMFPYLGKPFVQWVYEALRGSRHIGRIAVVGPVREITENRVVAGADLIVPERDSVESNLFAAIAEMLPEGRLLITACDNPLLTTAAFDDFVSRCPPEAALCYPILRHDAFLRQFPGAANIAIALRDGAWIGGGCVLVNSRSIPRLQRTIQSVLAARKSKRQMVSLLGWKFALKFALKRITCADVESRACEITGLPIRFIQNSSPLFPIDIDDPVDWDYLMEWSGREGLPVEG